MASLQGITGGMSGKLGSVVFRQKGGQTIAAQYQPVVKNPNSEGQQAQRARFKLMSQLAAVMSRGFGSFIIKTRPEKSRPSQRNAFVQLNFPLAVATETSTGVVAKIPMQQLQLTSSFRYLPNFEVVAAENTITGSMQGIASDIAILRVVLVNYRGNSITQAAIEEIKDFPVSDGIANIVFENLNPGNYTLLGYGLIPSASAAASIDLDNIHTPADEEFISAIELDKMVAAGEMAETMTVGENLTLS